MLFEVIFSPAMIAEMTDLWLNSSDRKQFTQSIHIIEELLGTSPYKHGEEIAEELFAIERHPLKLFYEIHESKFTVVVTGIAIKDNQ
jgi:mRNA-degrading endonuclease RelE of RelBE toxin-antitoxin system